MQLSSSCLYVRDKTVKHLFIIKFSSTCFAILYSGIFFLLLILPSYLLAQDQHCMDFYRPGKPKESIPAQLAEPCTFKNLELPPDFVVYAAGHYSGIKLPFQIDENATSAATETRVYVNVTSRPVVLMLGNYEPTVFQIYRTPETQIIAVYGSGYHPPIIAGIAPEIPALAPKASSTCKRFNLNARSGITETDRQLVNAISQQIFQKPVDHIVLAQADEAVYIGEQLDRAKYIQDRKQRSESFRMPNTPLAGQAGIQQALENGKIVPARAEDIAAWHQVSKYPSDYHLGDLSKDSIQRNLAKTAYVIEKPFRIPVGLNGSESVLFILKKGVPWPQGLLGQSQLMNMNDGLCWMGQTSDGALTSCAKDHFKEYSRVCWSEWHGKSR